MSQQLKVTHYMSSNPIVFGLQNVFTKSLILNELFIWQVKYKGKKLDLLKSTWFSQMKISMPGFESVVGSFLHFQLMFYCKLYTLDKGNNIKMLLFTA